MRRALAASLCWLAACNTPPPPPAIEEELTLAALALREGRLEEAGERVDAVRRREPRHVVAAQWQATIASLSWRDEAAVAAQQAAIRAARSAGWSAAAVADLEGRLGELLFQAGRYGDSVPFLVAGAIGAASARRRAFATVATRLSPLLQVSGPLLSEQPLLPGDVPEFACGVDERQRPFAIDTGTSMTTVSRSFADELGVAEQHAAGAALDSAGRELPVAVGVLPRFRVGDLELGAVPVLIADDAAMQLRDFHGGVERVPRGVLGLDLLAVCRMTIDPERGSVVLQRATGLPEASSIACVRADGRCLLPVFVEGVRLWFVLDTGASHSSLTAAGVDALPGGAGRTVPSFRRVRTVGGGLVAVREVRDLVLRCSEVRFQGVTLPVVPRGAATVFPVHGVLGIDLLGRCRVTLDRGRARLQAVP